MTDLPKGIVISDTIMPYRYAVYSRVRLEESIYGTPVHENGLLAYYVDKFTIDTSKFTKALTNRYCTMHDIEILCSRGITAKIEFYGVNGFTTICDIYCEKKEDALVLKLMGEI